MSASVKDVLAGVVCMGPGQPVRGFRNDGGGALSREAETVMQGATMSERRSRA
jgi:hypothetical protein